MSWEVHSLGVEVPGSPINELWGLNPSFFPHKMQDLGIGSSVFYQRHRTSRRYIKRFFTRNWLT